MSVAESCIRNEQALFFSRPRSELCRTKFLQKLARDGRRFAGRGRRDHRGLDFFGDPLALHFGIAVDDDVAEIGKKFGGAVAAARKAKKLGRLVEKRRGDFASAKLRV